MIRYLLSRAVVAYNRTDGSPAKTELTDWVLGRVGKVTARVSLAPNGFLEIDPADATVRPFLTDPHYLEDQWVELSRFVEQQEVVWDINAGIGCHSMRAVWDPGVLEVHSFENRPEMYRNLKRSGRHNQGRLFLHSFIPRANAESITIDEVIQKKLAPAPTLLRIAVVERELEVLEGAEGLFRTAPPKAVLFEASSDAAGVIREKRLRDFLEKHQLWFQRLDPRDLITDSRELYIAFRPKD